MTVDLTAVIIAVAGGEPQVLALDAGGGGNGDNAGGDLSGTRLDALPSGPLQPGHRTLQAGLRAWVEQQTQQSLGYVEQLYTFGDRARPPHERPRAPGGGSDGGVGGGDGQADAAAARRTLSLAYLALVSQAHTDPSLPARWRRWYDLLPWEDWRAGDPAATALLTERLRAWADSADGRARRDRLDRLHLTFGLGGTAWDEERALERYELLYEAGLVPEAWTDRQQAVPREVAELPGQPMTADHRRILATAISRLRGKIKYRPVLFELMPPTFTLLQLQRTAEALSGVRLHKQNFRRLVERQKLVEETGEIETDTGGRPAKLMRFRPEVQLERPAPGVRPGAPRSSRQR
ncbi:hypothetical protein CKO28_06990 [Rhodovibrio sodomensis]|uniref:NrtR DNA-binding winged helix domain-containing protein n=1 Tax=Rhodovibrio sodomensis TaxID=1088 RepID=A0ABS1DDF1_9PROT|nr:hypothetical protein [Rhodovibrio sodomensis]